MLQFDIANILFVIYYIIYILFIATTTIMITMITSITIITIITIDIINISINIIISVPTCIEWGLFLPIYNFFDAMIDILHALGIIFTADISCIPLLLYKFRNFNNLIKFIVPILLSVIEHYIIHIHIHVHVHVHILSFYG